MTDDAPEPPVHPPRREENPPGSVARPLPTRRPIPLPPESLRPAPPPRRRAGETPTRPRDPALGGSQDPGPQVGPAIEGIPALPPKPRVAGFSGRTHRSRRVLFPVGVVAILILAGSLGRGFLSRPGDEFRSPATANPPAATARIEAKPVEPESGEGETPPELVPEGAPSAQSRLVLQAASYRTRRRAEEVLLAIRAETGLSGAVLPSRVNGELWHRILIGPFSEEAEAARAAASLRATRLVGEALVRPVPPGWDAAQRPEGW